MLILVEAVPVEPEPPTHGTPVEVTPTAQPGVEVLRPIIAEDSMHKVESLQRKLVDRQARFCEYCGARLAR